MGYNTQILHGISGSIESLVGTYIFQTGKEYFVGEISGKEKEGGLIIHLVSGFLSSIEECEEVCYQMGRIPRVVIREVTLNELKDRYARIS